MTSTNPAAPSTKVTVTRKERAPVYDVWRRAKGPDWTRLAEAVAAPNRKEAIRAAVSKLPEEEQYGEFATSRTGEFGSQTRKRRVETTDVWE